MGSIQTKGTHNEVMQKLREAQSSLSPVNENRLLWNQEQAILDATELICAIMKETNVSRAELAKRMGTTKGNITQILNGSRNLTIRTVSDVLTHLGHEFRAACKDRQSGASHATVELVLRAKLTIDLGTSGNRGRRGRHSSRRSSRPAQSAR